MRDSFATSRRRREPGVIAMLGLLAWVAGCVRASQPAGVPAAATSNLGAVGLRQTTAQASSGEWISWREHIVDDATIGGVPIAGGDGLALADLDRDGHRDIVSVHESDTEYDGVADGYVRIAFGSARADRWHNVTLAEGADVGAAEDVAIGDVTGDGRPDVVVACALGHVVVFENPKSARTARWPRAILAVTQNRGSFIRVALADFDGDGRPEILTANKGTQNPPPDDMVPRAVSILELTGGALDPTAWTEHVLGRIAVPINAQPVDLDGDGDLDVLAGSRNELRILWFENVGTAELGFVEHAIEIAGTSIPERERPSEFRGGRALVTGFNVGISDLDGDGRVDVVLAEGFDRLVWLHQPERPAMPWALHTIGTIGPDTVAGLTLADIDGDHDLDVIVGGYSGGPRDRDGTVTVDDPLGRIAWFERRGDDNEWIRHDISRRKRGMFDGFVAVDLDADGDLDFAATRGNSHPYDGVFWLEQVRTRHPVASFAAARPRESEEVSLPAR